MNLLRTKSGRVYQLPIRRMPPPYARRRLTAWAALAVIGGAATLVWICWP